MTRWPRKPLAEVATIGSGAGFPIADQGKSDGEYPFLKVSDMNLPGNARTIECWNNTVTAEVRARLRATAFPTGSVIFPKIGAAIGTNKKRLLTRPCCVDNNVMAVTPERGSLESEYLFYLLLSTDISHFASDSNPPSIRKTVVEAWEVPVPPLSEQRRIVDVLSRAEGIVRLRREAQAKAAEIIPALFLDMFGDPAANPKGWPTMRISEIADIGSGNGFPIAYQGRASGSFPYYKVSDMNLPGNEVELRDANNYISQDDLRTLRATAYPPGTVVFPKIGAAIATNKKRVLTVAACFDNNVMGITPSDRLRSTYLYGLLQSKNISDFASDSNPPSIRKSTVEEWRVPLPPVSTQELFSQRVASARAIFGQQASATARAEAAFAALLGRAFSSGLTANPSASVEAALA